MQIKPCFICVSLYLSEPTAWPAQRVACMPVCDHGGSDALSGGSPVHVISPASAQSCDAESLGQLLYFSNQCFMPVSECNCVDDLWL